MASQYRHLTPRPEGFALAIALFAVVQSGASSRPRTRRSTLTPREFTVETRIRLTSEEAAPGSGYIVLNGHPDSPVTTLVRYPNGDELRANSHNEAFLALGNGNRYSHVELVTHAFPDAEGGPDHEVSVWVPVNPGS